VAKVVARVQGDVVGIDDLRALGIVRETAPPSARSRASRRR
jgi:hypothetical protein